MSVSSTYTAVSTSLDVTRRSRSSRNQANVRRTPTQLPATSLQNVVHHPVGSGGISKPTPNHCRTASQSSPPQRRLLVKVVIVHNPGCRARASPVFRQSSPKSCCLSAHRSTVAAGHCCECPCGYRQHTLSPNSVVRSLRHAHAGAAAQSCRSTEAPLTSSLRNNKTYGGVRPP